jgi:hypothetical protein
MPLAIERHGSEGEGKLPVLKCVEIRLPCVCVRGGAAPQREKNSHSSRRAAALLRMMVSGATHVCQRPVTCDQLTSVFLAFNSMGYVDAE